MSDNNLRLIFEEFMKYWDDILNGGSCPSCGWSEWKELNDDGYRCIHCKEEITEEDYERLVEEGMI